MREEAPLSHLTIEETEDEYVLLLSFKDSAKSCSSDDLQLSFFMYHCAESSSSTSRTKDSGVSCSDGKSEKTVDEATV